MSDRLASTVTAAKSVVQEYRIMLGAGCVAAGKNFPLLIVNVLQHLHRVFSPVHRCVAFLFP